MKKFFLVLFGSFFLCVFLLFVVTLRFGERWKIIPGLYSYPPCNTSSTSSLFFETPEDYIAWIENPDLGIDKMTNLCECTDGRHTIPLGVTIHRDYKYSIRSDLQRMFVVDRMYPLLHLQEGATSNGALRKYGVLSDGHMSWSFQDEEGNRYTLSIRTDEKRPYFTENTSTSPPTWEREMSREGDPYSIAPDPENCAVRQIGDETYFIKPSPSDPNDFTINWFEGNYVAYLYVNPKKSSEYDAAAIDVSHYLSYFEMEFVDLPPLQEKNTFPWVWITAGGLCLGAGIGTFFVVRKHRNSKKSSQTVQE